jgi:methylenetetrahydrofolate dehydrogenase (NADP+)/methenyltetrahydrofolate cyclohydrolase
MTAQILDGKALAEQLKGTLKNNVITLKNKIGRVPGIAVVLVGDDPASQVYVNNKLKCAEMIGVKAFTYKFNADISETALVAQIDALNKDSNVDGILVQLPLPQHLRAEVVLTKILASKDIDGFHVENIGRLALKQTGLHPCTPKGIMTLLKHYVGDIKGMNAVVIGASNIVGRPMALELLNARCTVTICHRATKDLADETRRADLIVVAAGVPHILNDVMVKPGVIVVDVGIHRLPDGSLTGDVDFKKVAPLAAWISPVPGGVGPMTVVTLMQNLLLATEMAHHAESIHST